MRTVIKIAFLPFVILLSHNAYAQATRIISGSTNFSVKFVLGTCNGTFDSPKGEVVFDEKKPETSSFHVTIAATSFKTGNNTRDKDMKSEKYFFVTKYPLIRFKSSKIEQKNGKYVAHGTLTIRDVSKTVSLPFTAQKNSDGSYALTSTFEINRLDYGIGEKDWKLKDVVTVDLKTLIK